MMSAETRTERLKKLRRRDKRAGFAYKKGLRLGCGTHGLPPEFSYPSA